MNRPILLATIILAALGARARGAEGEFWTEPRGNYESRRREVLERAAAAEPGGLYGQVARLELGRGPLNEDAIRKAIAFVRERRDTADFVAAGLLRVESYGEGPLLPRSLRDEIRGALLGFKYGVGEPGDDLLSMWSENHQIAYHSAEFLAGQLLPDATFPNDGRSGARHRDEARRKVLRWIDLKAKVGFCEWDSNSYYPVDVAALLNLADLARDREVASRARMLLDVLFFDMAVDSFRGTFGTSHGRSYAATNARGGPGEGTSPLQRIAWGLGARGGPEDEAAVFLAASRTYRVSPTIRAIGVDRPEELTNRERQSLLIEDAPRFGLRPDDPDDFFLVSEGGKFSSIPRIEASLRVTDRLPLHRYRVVIRPYAEAVLGTYRALEARGLPVPDLDNSSLARVDKITYRTPDYQLSAAQDYRKGAPGFQQHIWQATLGPDAVVFTFNPGPTSKYWQGRFPRAAQHRNVLIALYDIPSERPPGPSTIVPPDAGGNAYPSPGPSEEVLAPRTLAVLRRSAFDEVRQRDGWTFGRKGRGYVALWSRSPTTWSDRGVIGGEGLVAEGRRNVWVCLLGREAVDGPFPAWADRVASAPLAATPSSVRFDAPGLGVVSFAWDGPLLVSGRAIPPTDYPRFDNPYCLAPYGSGRYDISHAGHRLLIDFPAGTSEESTPADPVTPVGRASSAPPTK